MQYLLYKVHDEKSAFDSSDYIKVRSWNSLHYLTQRLCTTLLKLSQIFELT